MSIILERASYRCIDDRFHIRTRVNEVIILTTALANQFWIVPVFGEILTDLRPQTIECRHRTGKVESGEIRRGRDGVAEYRSIAWNEIHHARRHPGFPAYLKDPPVGQ